MTELLPQESESQEVGQRAKQALWAQLPNTWRLEDLSGDTDAGLDFQVQVVVDRRYGDLFHIQLKGSRRNKISADGKVASVSIKVSTANYYKRLGRPVMLVLADFSTVTDPKTCPVYYVWIHNQLDQKLAEVGPNAKADSEITFHLPTSDRLAPDLDVTPYLNQVRDQRESMVALERAIVGVPLEITPSAAISQFTQNINERGALYLETSLAESETPWPDPQPGTTSWKLKQLSELISQGALSDAEAVAKNVASGDLRDEQEIAEFAFLRGRLATMRGRLADAVPEYATAHARFPANSRYFSSWAEARLLTSPDLTVAAAAQLQEVQQTPSAASPRTRAYFARLLILLGRFEEASAVLDAIPQQFCAVERMLALDVQRRWDEVIDYLATSQALPISRMGRLTLRVLAARARFMKAFYLSGERQMIAPSGPSNLDVAALPSLWTDFYSLASDLRNASWPPNSEILIDALTAVAIAVGAENEGLVLTDEFLRARPDLEALQVSRIKLAVFARKYDVAAAVALKLSNSIERAIHLALIRYQAEDYQSVVDLVPELLAIPFDADELLREALSVAADSARRVLKPDIAEACAARLSEGGFKDRVALLKFIALADSGKDKREEARRQLIADLHECPDSAVLQDHALRELSPVTDAALIGDLASRIRKRRQLLRQEVLLLADSLNRADKRTAALAEVKAARLRFPKDSNLIAFEALIHERDGNVPYARTLLEDLLSQGDAPELARSIYINIAARSGFLEEAGRQLERLLTDSSKPADKKDTLRALFSIEFYRRATPSRIVTIARKYGELADRTSETEEGLFLIMMFSAAVLEGAVFDDALQEEVRSRAAAYVQRFPESTVFGAVPLPKNGDSAAITTALRTRFGQRREDIAALDMLRTQVRRGELAMPYAWRPRLVVPGAAGVTELWELTKRSSSDAIELKFGVAAATDAPGWDGKGAIPLIDLLSLLVLTDLDLWSVVFRVFERIAITKETMLRIQMEPGLLEVATPTLVELRPILRREISRVYQPGTVSESWPRRRDGGLDEQKELVESGSFTFYSDDMLARAYVLENRGPTRGFNTLDLLNTAVARGHLTAVDSARKVAQMARWGLGVSVTYRDLVAVIPESLASTASLKGKIDVLFQDLDFNSLSGGLWNAAKSYQEVTNHAAAVLARVARENPEVDPLSIAAIWAIWLDKVSLRTDVELTVEQHLAAILILACLFLKDKQGAARKMWVAFFALVERYYKDRMSVEKEREAIRVVGGMIAGVVNTREDIREKADDTLRALRGGLTAGTAEEAHLLKAYEGRRSEKVVSGRKNGNKTNKTKR
jgi:hypothetical protein